MNRLLIKNARIVNEGQIVAADVRIAAERIDQIGADLAARGDETVLDAGGKHLLPGMIDDQVHFREPGFPNKGTIASESRAAVAGGITSYMEMPNVTPQTTNRAALAEKVKRATASSLANFSFYLGATNDNIDEIKALQGDEACGVKVFMGASTGNMLVDQEATLGQIFAGSPLLIATHCEDTPMIQALEQQYRQRYGEDVPIAEHARIRSEAACYKSSSFAVELAKKHGSRLHVLHITTAKELELFQPVALEQLGSANITAEVCVHHLAFNEQDYATLGTQIKCNPSVKTAADQQALLQAVNDDRIAVIATDHAPHTWEEKQQSYFKAPSGVPLVQHALLSLLDHYHQGIFSLETIVKKTSHAVAERFGLKDRGYIREGYFADLVLVDTQRPYTVSKDNLLYHCGWSPFEGHRFAASIDTTLVNGQVVYQNGAICSDIKGQQLTFNR